MAECEWENWPGSRAGLFSIHFEQKRKSIKQNTQKNSTPPFSQPQKRKDLNMKKKNRPSIQSHFLSAANQCSPLERSPLWTRWLQSVTSQCCLALNCTDTQMLARFTGSRRLRSWDSPTGQLYGQKLNTSESFHTINTFGVSGANFVATQSNVIEVTGDWFFKCEREKKA